MYYRQEYKDIVAGKIAEAFGFSSIKLTMFRKIILKLFNVKLVVEKAGGFKENITITSWGFELGRFYVIFPHTILISCFKYSTSLDTSRRWKRYKITN